MFEKKSAQSSFLMFYRLSSAKLYSSTLLMFDFLNIDFIFEKRSSIGFRIGK